MTNATQTILGDTLLVVLLIVGGAGSVWCFFQHICVGGHMLHPPYSTGEYIADVAWTLALVAVPIVSWRWQLFGRFWWFTLAVLALPLYRFVFGSGGGFGVLGLPI